MTLKAVVDTLDNIPAQFHELYTERNGKFEINAIEGLKTQADIDRLQISLNKERIEHKATKDKFAPLNGFDISEIQAKLDRIPELEAAASGKLDDVKLNELVETRLKGRVAPIERELLNAKKDLTAKDEIIQSFAVKERSRAISSAVSTAARKAGIQDTAFEDAIILAERVFDVDETGAVVVKDQVGFTPGIDPNTWFSELQPKRPHWWAESRGGGASGTGGNRTGIVNPFTDENWNLTEQGKLVTTNPTLAQNLAKSAGTTVGGRRPEKKK